MGAEAKSSAGGVRNLCAVFENKDESSTSPPERGRSPVGSIGGGSNGTSPRPLPKVRTSFVAVERNGQLGIQLGLKKENHGKSTLAKSTSFGIDEESNPKALADKTESVNAERKSTAMAETIPESASEKPLIESEKQPGQTNSRGARGQALPAESKASGDLHKKTSVDDRKSKVQRVDVTVYGKPKPSSPTIGIARPPPATSSTGPAPVNTTRNSGSTKPTAKSVKSPTVPKTPTTPVKIPTTPGKTGRPSQPKSTTSNPADLVKALDHKVVKSSASSNTVKNPAQPEVASANTTATKRINQVTSGSAFHRSRPKSPTRPVKLPSSMTAPTASSLSKVFPASPPSRQAYRLAQEHNPRSISRPPSRANLTSNNELRRKSSTLIDRPALGRPPTSTSVRKQPSRQSLSSVPASDGFLARMMRPTTSSASKTNEKVVTPPRSKSSTRPTTRDGPSHQKVLEGHKGSPPTKRYRTMPNAPKFEDLKAVNAASTEHPETKKLPVVEPSVEPIIKNGYAEQAVEEKSEIKDEKELVATEMGVESTEELSAVKEPLETTSKEPVTEEVIHENSVIAPEPDLPPSIMNGAIPENSAIAPEPDLATCATEGGTIGENIAVTSEPESPLLTVEEPITKEEKGLDGAEEPTDVISEEALAAEQTPSTNDVSEQPTEDSID